MTDTRLTEERLRNWLDSNQVQRERLCIHLLPLLGNYSEVEPRRPKGGPDGARDLQAIFEAELRVWGAVGFRNSVSDSAKDKQWVANKFRSDLELALASEPDLKGFVFFTNVDLTPSEQKELTSFAFTKGIVHIQIFYRERLRQVLDGMAGFGYRLQYLDIEMSREEQVSFINLLGEKQEAYVKRIANLQDEAAEQLKRNEFLTSCLRSVSSFAFMLVLDKRHRTSELGHFRVYGEIQRIYESPPWPSLFFAIRDSYFGSPASSGGVPFFGLKTIDRNKSAGSKLDR